MGSKVLPGPCYCTHDIRGHFGRHPSAVWEVTPKRTPADPRGCFLPGWPQLRRVQNMARKKDKGCTH